MASKECYENTSEEFSVNCSICMEENKNVRAENYCVECNDYYCSACVTIHRTVPALRSHKLLDKEAGQDGKLPLVPTERCEKHLFKPVDMFCENHDEVGCYTCMAVEHRLCQDVFFIPDLMKTRADEVTDFVQVFTDIETRLQLFHERFLRWRDSLQKSKGKELKKISDLRESLEQKIKAAEQIASREVEKDFQNLDNDLQTNIEFVKSELESTGKTKRQITSTSNNSSQAFVLIKKNRENQNSAKTACEAIAKVNINHGIRFEPNLDLEEQMCLGNISQEQESFLYKFSKKGNIDITAGSVSETNDTLGSCVLNDGSVVLADCSRKELQLIDSKTMSVSDQYSLDASPWGVCCLDANEIAVCLTSGKRIQMFIVDGHFTPSRSITVEFLCKAIAFCESKFYLSDATCVYVCSEEGNILKTFRDDFTGKALFSSIFSICVSNDGLLIYACDFDNGVITLGNDGNVYNIVSTEIASPNGVAIDDNGNVFVCGHASKNIVQLDKLGLYTGNVIKTVSNAPQSICFDSKLKRLYIPYHITNKVEIFEVEY